MTATETAMARIFLSASAQPDDLRELRMRPDAWEDVYLGYPTRPEEIEKAVRGTMTPVLRRSDRRIVFGGHPAITRLITKFGKELARDNAEPGVEIFQSAYFAGKEHFSTERDQDVYSRIQWTPICEPGDTPHPVSDTFSLGEHPDRETTPAHETHRLAKERKEQLDASAQATWLGASLAYMRHEMIGDCALGVFIGGMKGIKEELGLFETLNPGKPVWLITRPGGRTERIAREEQHGPHRHIVDDKDYDFVGQELAELDL